MMYNISIIIRGRLIEMQKVNRNYLYNYLYALIMFLGILTLTFLFSTFENYYNEVVDEYNDAIKYAISENFSEETKENILRLNAEVEKAKIEQRYNNFVSIMIVFIFLIMFNYFYITVGKVYKCLKKTPSLDLMSKLLVTTGIFEILYFLVLVIFVSNSTIGNNFWTLFYVNIMIMIFVVVLSLQIQYLIKPKKKESLD